MSPFAFKTSRSFFLGFISTDLRILQDPESGLVNDLFGALIVSMSAVRIYIGEVLTAFLVFPWISIVSQWDRYKSSYSARKICAPKKKQNR